MAAVARGRNLIATLEPETESNKQNGANKMPRIEGIESHRADREECRKVQPASRNNGESNPLTHIYSRVRLEVRKP